MNYENYKNRLAELIPEEVDLRCLPALIRTAEQRICRDLELLSAPPKAKG